MDTESGLEDVCVAACADMWRGSGAILANPTVGYIPAIGVRLAKATFEPDLVIYNADSALVAEVGAIGPGATDAAVEGHLTYRDLFHVLWSGRRHVVMGATQIDRYGNQNISCIGPWERPKIQLVGVRGAPGNTVSHPTSYWIPSHTKRVFVDHVDVVSGVGYDRAKRAGGEVARRHRLGWVITNLCVLDFEDPDHAMRLRSVHPGVTVDRVVASTGFDLVIPAEVPESRRPTDAELQLIREVIDPKGLRIGEVSLSA
jgi:acyl CoA:acetate/3-ketoacid CoA transferase beta subunit